MLRSLLGRSGSSRTTSTFSASTRGRSLMALSVVALVASMFAVVPATPVQAAAPGAPSNPAPANAAINQSTSPTLSVRVTDPDGNAMTVTFMGRAFASGNFVQIAQKTNVASGATTTTPWTGLGAGQKFEWFVTARDATITTTGPTWTFTTTNSTDPVFVGAGDIAECSNPGDESTAQVISGVAGQVFTVGDNVYPDGALVNFNNCYDPSWGGSIKARTRPMTGNHDWAPGNLTGYFAYYGASAGGNSYYSYDIAGSNWHVVALDTECTFVAGGCGVGSAQVNWLTSDLNANPTKNVIAMIHRPRYSSGSTNQTELQPLYDVMYQHNVDIVLQGHDHIYERQAPMNAAGAADPTHGMRVFTVGTGGQSHHGISSVRATSEVRDNTTFGIFKLTLHASTYDWKFLPVAGATFTDSGTGTVFANAANQAPVAVADSYSTTLNTALTVAAPGVLANDTDADGNPLTAAVVTSVSHGTLSLASNGGFTYTPTNGYTGPRQLHLPSQRRHRQLEHGHRVTDRDGHRHQQRGPAQRLQPVHHLRRGPRAQRQQLYPRALVHAHRRGCRHLDRHRRDPQRHPAADQGSGRSGDAGQPEHGLVPGHRCLERPAGGRLRGQRHRRQPPGHRHRRGQQQRLAPRRGDLWRGHLEPVSRRGPRQDPRRGRLHPRGDQHPARRPGHGHDLRRRGRRLLPGRGRRGPRLERGPHGGPDQRQQEPRAHLGHRPARSLGAQRGQRHDRRQLGLGRRGRHPRRDAAAGPGLRPAGRRQHRPGRGQ